MSRSALWMLVPLLLLAIILTVLIYGRPLERLTSAAPPVEDVKVTSTRLSPGLISLTIQGDGSHPISVSQVQVDGAYRLFTMTPGGPIKRLGTARLDIPYPWIDGEKHSIAVVTRTGAVFEHAIEVAQETPSWEASNVVMLTLIGLLLGLAPVAAGLLAFPAMRGLGPVAIQFVLAVTVGLLLYLFIDTLSEGLEMSGKAIDRLHAETVVWVSAIATALALLAVGRREGRAPEGVALAGFIALGIGLHNFGEGLAVGASLATGAAALATFLVIGFTIHNVSEGFGIAAPLIGARPSLPTFIWLAALAGLPAVAGVWLGVQSVSPYWTALCFGVGAGAIAQVVIEVGALIVRRSGNAALTRTASLAGVITGLAVMYGTALLV